MTVCDHRFLNNPHDLEGPWTQLNLCANSFISDLLSDAVDDHVDDCVHDIDGCGNDDAGFACDVHSCHEPTIAECITEEDYDSDSSCYDVAMPFFTVSPCCSDGMENNTFNMALKNSLDWGDSDDIEVSSLMSDEIWEDVEEDESNFQCFDRYVHAAERVVNAAVEAGILYEQLALRRATASSPAKRMLLAAEREACMKSEFAAWAAGLEQQVATEDETHIVKAAQDSWVCNFVDNLVDEGIRATATEQACAEKLEADLKLLLGQVTRRTAKITANLEAPLPQPAATVASPAEGALPIEEAMSTERTAGASKKEGQRKKAAVPPVPQPATPSRSKRRIIGGVVRAPAKLVQPIDNALNSYRMDIDNNNISIPKPRKSSLARVYKALDAENSYNIDSQIPAVPRTPKPAHSGGSSAMAQDLGEGAMGRSRWAPPAIGNPQPPSDLPMPRASSLGAFKVIKMQHAAEFVSEPRRKVGLLPTISGAPSSSGSVAWSLHMARSTVKRNNLDVQPNFLSVP